MKTIDINNYCPPIENQKASTKTPYMDSYCTPMEGRTVNLTPNLIDEINKVAGEELLVYRPHEGSYARVSVNSCSTEPSWTINFLFRSTRRSEYIVGSTGSTNRIQLDHTGTVDRETDLCYGGHYCFNRPLTYPPFTIDRATAEMIRGLIITATSESE